MSEPVLTADEQAFASSARRGILATIKPDGDPRLVPVCFVVRDEPDDSGRLVIYSPIDEKRKQSADPHRLARVSDLLVLPHVSLLIDRWSEDWARLGWLRLSGRAELLEPEPREAEEHAMAVRWLRAKYPQYASHDLEHRPIVRMAIDRVQRWGDVTGEAGPVG